MKKGKKPGKRGWIILASAVGIVVFIAVIGIVVFRKSPEELSDKINAARQSGATSLDLSGVDTGSVTDMSNMISGYTNLKELNLSDFDTSSVVYMYRMFSDCSSLEKLDLSSFDTSSVVGMHEMFLGCSSLETVYLGDGWTDEWIECVEHAYPEIHFVMK